MIQHRSIAAIITLVAAAATAQSSGPPSHEPVSNTFATAAQTVLDTAAAVDLHASSATFQAQFQNLMAQRENLQKLSSNDREQTIVDAVKEIGLTLQACHIQAIDGADLTRCQATLDRDRERAMDVLGSHKVNGAWTAGPHS